MSDYTEGGQSTRSVMDWIYPIRIYKAPFPQHLPTHVSLHG